MNRELLVLELNHYKAQLSNCLRTPVSNESLIKAEVIIEEFKVALNTLKEEVSEDIRKIVRLNRTAEKIEEEKQALYEPLNTAFETYVHYQTKIKAAKVESNKQVQNSSLLNNSSINSGNTSALPRLPKIEIPGFSGNVREFLSFKNLFDNLIIQNPDLNNTQRFYYLKQSLSGEPADIIRDFETSDGAFSEAWKLLSSRYDNRSYIIQTYFEDLNSLDQIHSEAGIRELVDKYSAAVRGLNTCGVRACNTDGSVCPWSMFLAYFLGSKLDRFTSRDWENSRVDMNKFPTEGEMIKFLNIRSFSYENRSRNRVDSGRGSPAKRNFERAADGKKSSLAVGAPRCNICTEQHYTDQCNKLLAKNSYDRHFLVKQNRLCTNCLGGNHRTMDCKASLCKKCGGRHHTVLHRETTVPVDSPDLRNPNNMESSPPGASTSDGGSGADSPGASKSFAVSLLAKEENKAIILPTAVVKVYVETKSGAKKCVLGRLLLDSGSQANLVSEKFIRQNKVKAIRNTEAAFISGIDNRDVPILFSTHLNLSSRVCNFGLSIEADVVREIPFSVHANTLKTIKSKFPGYEFAERDTLNERVDILLGVEYIESCFKEKRVKIDNVFIRETYLGWVISGTYPRGSNFIRKTCQAVSISLERQLEKFWQIEEATSVSESLSEHTTCVKHFEETFSRDIEGRFVVRLPFKDDRAKIGKSYDRAVSSLRRVESSTPKEIRSMYIDFMREYEKLGHMEEVQDELQEPAQVYYIPHRAVLRPSSLTTKLRVVFNASSRSGNQPSLNDLLMVGPKIQSELMDILVRFRNHAVAFSADITKMYRQVMVHEKDRDFQRIVWRENSSEPVKIYRLNTVTYGTASASFLATKCLAVLATEVSENLPETSRAISMDFYMDDLLTGASSVKEAAAIMLNIHKTLLRGCFPLRKYVSNTPEIFKFLEPELIEERKTVEFNDEEITTLLGLKWNPREDSFSVNLDYQSDEIIENLTKRSMLSLISRVFDPLGLLSPVTIRAKIILQQLWREQLKWDELIPELLRESFVSYYRELFTLREVSFKRRYTSFHNVKSRKLIGFCDASEKAYCAVIYVRSVNADQEVQCSLVCAKTRVAPLKRITIPQLELQAAVLLAELISRIARVMNADISGVTVFSDSTTVLHWLKGDIYKWTIYVRNRVEKISGILNSDQWEYVSTLENPADLATRGLTADQLKNSKMWFNGPQFLYEGSSYQGTLPETRISLVHQFREKPRISLATNEPDVSIIERYSSYTKLIKIVAYVLRFGNNCRNLCGFSTTFNRKSYLELEERKTALLRIIKLVQTNAYFREVMELSKGRIISKYSTIKSLCPFLDENRILRVNGRLENSDLPYDRRNPVILPAKSQFVELLVRYEHYRSYHGTRSYIRNRLADKYRIHGGLTNVIKRVIRTCNHCVRFSAKTAQQVMGQLPAARVTISRPFDRVGVDFAGPFECKCVKHRSVKFYKVYAAFFVCFCTRAVHIELVSGLSSEDFLLSLQRFIARRGVPNLVYSDNGRNFVGAQPYLFVQEGKVQEYAIEVGIKWIFIPPYSPNKGGLWEAAVKAAKHHLVRITLGKALNYEDYSTLFTNIEAVLNSRPISYKPLSGDIESVAEAITPAHFLVGSPLLSPSPFFADNLNITHLKRYELLKSKLASFWSQWQRDYLNQYQQRYKWANPARNVQVGDVVIIKREAEHPAAWNLGVVIQVFPDREGFVRTVDVKTLGTVKRLSLNSLIIMIPNEPLAVHPGENVHGEIKADK